MEALLERCDKLFHSGHHVESLGTILELRNDPHPEVQWRLARSIFKGSEQKSGAEKHAAIADAAQVLKELITRHEDCWNAHIWYAIVLGSKEKHESFKQQIEEAFIIKKHVDRCIELNPSSELAYHVLGNWCYQVASVSWFQRRAAAALFAKLPEASLEDALAALKQAEQLCPNIFNGNHLALARVLIDMGRKDEARPYLEKCVQLPAGKEADSDSLENAEDARKLAKKNGINL